MKPCRSYSKKETAQNFNERLQAAADGKYYTFAQYDEWISEVKEYTPTVAKNKKSYYNVPASFDIETTSFYENGEKRACMYIWMFCINCAVIIGREWTEYIRLIERITEDLQLNDDNRLIVYVHNLAFEIQFLRHRFTWRDSFCSEERRPFYMLDNNGIIYKCSFFLSGTSLDHVGKNLTTYKVKKLTGSLDYSKIRNSKTELSHDEMMYCINDVLVLQAYIQERIESDGDITKIPLTKTGYARNLCRYNCLYGEKNHKTYSSIKRFRNYSEIMQATNLTVDEYKQLKRAYCGGFTHGNNYYSGVLINENVTSKDFTSSYPFHLIAKKYPYECELYTPTTKEDFEKQMKMYYCVFDVAFTNIYDIFHYEHYISRSKCFKITGETVDNGRIVSADYLLTTITSDDYDIIKRCYAWDNMTIYNFRRYTMDYLPTDFIKTVIKLYKDKTMLKGVAGEERNYLSAKELLNSLYGMCATDFCRDETKYKDDTWQTTGADIEKAVEYYNKDKRRFTSFVWSVRCTSAARHSLWTAILECKGDYLYADTDSIKLTNYADHKSYFDYYNRSVVYELKKACCYHGIPFDDVAPKTIEGETKIIGLWDDDGEYKRFKYLGAKRYLSEDYKNELHLTVAGVGKKNALVYLKNKYKDNTAVFNAFDDKLTIPDVYDIPGFNVDTLPLEQRTPSGKNLHTYIDDETRGLLTDYQGHTAPYNELSSVHLEPTTYKLRLSDEYIAFLQSVHEYAY